MSSDNLIWHAEIFDHKYGDWYFTHPVSGNGMLLNRYRYIRPVQVQPEHKEMPEWDLRLLAILTEIASAKDDGQYREAVEFLIKHVRPLITPKQVTDEMIKQRWSDLYGHISYMSDAIELVRWALQKAEGGEG